MNVDKALQTRLRITYWSITVLSLIILGRMAYIQIFEGSYYMNMAKEMQRIIEKQSKRGNIFSEDGHLLATDIVYYDVYIDFLADGLVANQWKRLKDNIDSLSFCLSNCFGDNSKAMYKEELEAGMIHQGRYYLLKKSISYRQFKAMKKMPLIRLGRIKSGFIFERRVQRLMPYGLDAARTIGTNRSYIDSSGLMINNYVGLEKSYDSVLKGAKSIQLMQPIGKGKYEAVKGLETMKLNGADLVTTLDMYVQHMAEKSLLKMMEAQEAQNGCTIVMECKTGKIKAIANLSRQTDGSYFEDMNYALASSEPGNTFSLVALIALLENKYASLNTPLNLGGASLTVNEPTVYDVEPITKGNVTLREAFEQGSNVAIAKQINANYSNQPMAFIDFVKRLKMHEYSGIDISGESFPIIKTPKSTTWSPTSLSWMSIGYEVQISPLQILMLYNAIANEGKLMKPYLMKEIRKGGLLKKNDPQVRVRNICSKATLAMVREALEGVCENGTAKYVFEGSAYKVAGKTATTLIGDGNSGYSNHIYQSSFVGYFPADNPKYSCIVNILSKPFAKKYYGSAVAAPVFKEIADALFRIAP